MAGGGPVAGDRAGGGRPVPLQQQARALGDRTRYELFRYLVDAGRPVGVAELTDHVALNHNAVRQHLAKLLDAGLIVEDRVRGGGPGRPRLVYEVDPGVGSRWGVVGPYERLSLLLTDVIRTGDTPVEVGRRASLEHRRPTTGPEQVIANVADAMARLGFEPERGGDGARPEVVLGTCPFASAALADRDTVCSLHLGLALGLTEGTEVAVDELVINDPRRAGCRLRLHVAPARAGDGS